MQPETQQPQPEQQVTPQQPVVPAGDTPEPQLAAPQPPVNPTPPPEEKAPKEGGIFSFIGTLIAAFLLVQFINLFLFQSYKVFGSSMYPTLEDGDRLIISKVGKSASRVMRNTYEPQRGEIIVFDDPHGSGMQLIKRVIGLPGERVIVADGQITVYNGEHPDGFHPDDAEYGARLPRSSGNVDIVVPPGHLFVSGDNREGNNSLDSRNELGTLPEELIIGTLSVRIFPFDRANFF